MYYGCHSGGDAMRGAQYADGRATLRSAVHSPLHRDVAVDVADVYRVQRSVGARRFARRRTLRARSRTCVVGNRFGREDFSIATRSIVCVVVVVWCGVRRLFNSFLLSITHRYRRHATSSCICSSTADYSSISDVPSTRYWPTRASTMRCAPPPPACSTRLRAAIRASNALSATNLTIFSPYDCVCVFLVVVVQHFVLMYIVIVDSKIVGCVDARGRQQSASTQRAERLVERQQYAARSRAVCRQSHSARQHAAPKVVVSGRAVQSSDAISVSHVSLRSSTSGGGRIVWHRSVSPARHWQQ
jgi:hypothetical protein